MTRLLRLGGRQRAEQRQVESVWQARRSSWAASMADAMREEVRVCLSACQPGSWLCRGMLGAAGGLLHSCDACRAPIAAKGLAPMYCRLLLRVDDAAWMQGLPGSQQRVVHLCITMQ